MEFRTNFFETNHISLINNLHENIEEYWKTMIDEVEGLTEDIILLAKKKKKVFVFDGSIAAGKSTVVKYLNDFTDFNCVTEPVHVWQSIGIIKNETFINCLELYYMSYDGIIEEKYMPVFQCIVMLSRLTDSRRTLTNGKDNEVFIFERHPLSD